MGNRIFYGFLILIFSALLWLIPVTSLVYSFRTDVTTNTFYSPTAVGSDNVTVTLTDFLYATDTTIDIISDLNTDDPTFVSYNITTRATVINGLTTNTTRTLTLEYDTEALTDSAWDTILDLFPTIWMILVICFPVVGLVAILIMRNN